eukprot:sb/3462710/
MDDNISTPCMSLESEVFGVHTVTTGAVLHPSSSSLSVPFSRSIRTWAPDGSHLDHATPHHRSIITFLSCSPDGSLLVSGDWSGIVAVYSAQWKLKLTFTCPSAPLALAKFIDNTTLVVLGRGKREFDPGCLAVYQLSNDSAELIVSTVDRIYQVAVCQNLGGDSIGAKGNLDEDTASTGTADEGAASTAKGGDREFLAWRWCEPEFTLLKLRPPIEKHGVLKEVGRWDITSEMSMGCALNSTYTVLSTKSRDLVVLDSGSLAQIAHHKTVSSIPIWAMVFSGTNHVILQKNSSTMIILDVVTGVTVRSFPGPGAFSCYLATREHTLWAVTVDGICRYESETPFLTLQHHSVSCAGVDICGDTILSGDMSGNLLLWKSPSVTPLIVAVVPDSVRCVRFENLSRAFFGTLTGSLYQANLVTMETDCVMNAKDTMTCIEVHNGLLCAGVVSGEVEVFTLSEPYPVHNFTLLVHHPDPTCTNPRFGSLHIRAEIWSIAFSPDDDTLIATSSEDQTVIITDLATKEQAAVIRGDHSLAVTAVAWCTWKGKSLIVTCSDDNTAVIREWLMEERKVGCVLVRMALPGNVIGASTLTYIGFVKKESELFVVCTSSGGYVIVWRVSGGESSGVLAEESPQLFAELGHVVYSERIHQGSVEGLGIREDGVFVTCGADNCVQRHTLAF